MFCPIDSDRYILFILPISLLKECLFLPVCSFLLYMFYEINTTMFISSRLHKDILPIPLKHHYIRQQLRKLHIRNYAVVRCRPVLLRSVFKCRKTFVCYSVEHLSIRNQKSLPDNDFFF